MNAPPQAPIEVSPLAWLDEVATQRRGAGLRRSLRPRPAVATELDLASNDYLGLSQHRDVIEGGVAALRMWGAGATGSRLVTGDTELHQQFESELADFVGAAVLLGLHGEPRGRRRPVGSRFAAGFRRPVARVAGGRVPAVAGPGGGGAAPRRGRRGRGPGLP